MPPPKAEKACATCQEINPNAQKKCKGCGADLVQSRKAVKEDFLNKSSSTEIKNLLEKRAHQLWANHNYHVVVLYFADAPKRKRCSSFGTPGKAESFRRSAQESLIRSYEVFMRKDVESDTDEEEEEEEEEREVVEQEREEGPVGEKEGPVGEEEGPVGEEEGPVGEEEGPEGEEEGPEGEEEGGGGDKEGGEERPQREGGGEEDAAAGSRAGQKQTGQALKRAGNNEDPRRKRRKRWTRRRKGKKECCCSVCGEKWAMSAPRELWIECMACKNWTHERCTGGTEVSHYICSNCPK